MEKEENKNLKEIDWEEVEREEKIYLEKYANFEKDLKRIKKKVGGKSLELISKEVNEFLEENKLPYCELKIKDEKIK